MRVKTLIKFYNECCERIRTENAQFMRLIDTKTYRAYMKRYNLKLMIRQENTYIYKNPDMMRNEIHNFELHNINKGLYVFDIDHWKYSHL